ncbi:hypothetical protein [uncultured Akkermansia sp.]|uniref:hypothetical protein n=1 Tax=uncultured Akkermansia sp. TaxID=512294 RepID=UPI00265CC1D8|nr:hypothetical protein [uncultured Akkermansia sp.]
MRGGEQGFCGSGPGSNGSEGGKPAAGKREKFIADAVSTAGNRMPDGKASIPYRKNNRFIIGHLSSCCKSACKAIQESEAEEKRKMFTMQVILKRP